mgnify:CR=1 FL=1
MPARDDDHHLGWILARGPIVTGPCIKNVNFYGGGQGSRRLGGRLSRMSLRINMDTTSIYTFPLKISLLLFTVHHCSDQPNFHAQFENLQKYLIWIFPPKLPFMKRGFLARNLKSVYAYFRYLWRIIINACNPNSLPVRAWATNSPQSIFKPQHFSPTKWCSYDPSKKRFIITTFICIMTTSPLIG